MLYTGVPKRMEVLDVITGKIKRQSAALQCFTAFIVSTAGLTKAAIACIELKSRSWLSADLFQIVI